MVVLANVINRRRKIKSIQVKKKERKLLLFTNDIIIYVADLKKLLNLLELISDYSKYVGYNVNTQKSITFLNTRNVYMGF